MRGTVGLAKANACLTFRWLRAGLDLHNVAGMKRLAVLVAMTLAAGCSAGGAAVQTAGSGQSGQPAPSSASPAVVPSGVRQAAVPAEKNPPGDIPDNVAFVAYRNAPGRYTFRHPEGWSETTRGNLVTFTDKLNGVQVKPGLATTTPTVDTAKQRDVPALASSQAAFELRGVTAVNEPGGQGVRIVYRRNSVPDPVTGRQYRDEVERYELVAAGRDVVIELFGPVGSDNVDAYRTMVQSLRLS